MSISEQARTQAEIAALAADELKAEDISVLDVSDTMVITDGFVIATGDNERHVNAITEKIEEKLREHGDKPVRREGAREGKWSLLDYGSIIVHVQRRDEREFYALDRLWGDAPSIQIEGVETIERPEAWDTDSALSATSAEDLPLAGEEPSDD